jgi:hypothetical protein
MPPLPCYHRAQRCSALIASSRSDVSNASTGGLWPLPMGVTFSSLSTLCAVGHPLPLPLRPLDRGSPTRGTQLRRILSDTGLQHVPDGALVSLPALRRLVIGRIGSSIDCRFWSTWSIAGAKFGLTVELRSQTGNLAGSCTHRGNPSAFHSCVDALMLTMPLCASPPPSAPVVSEVGAELAEWCAATRGPVFAWTCGGDSFLPGPSDNRCRGLGIDNGSGGCIRATPSRFGNDGYPFNFS